MKVKQLAVGIMPKEEFVKMTLAIVKGEYKPKKGEPKIWFESLQSLAQVLSLQNQELLYIIKEREPQSLKELGVITGRATSNLSRTLHMLESYGIVEFKKTKKGLRPIAKVTDFKLETGINTPWFAEWAKEQEEKRASAP